MDKIEVLKKDIASLIAKEVLRVMGELEGTSLERLTKVNLKHITILPSKHHYVFEQLVDLRKTLPSDTTELEQYLTKVYLRKKKAFYTIFKHNLKIYPEYTDPEEVKPIPLTEEEARAYYKLLVSYFGDEADVLYNIAELRTFRKHIWYGCITTPWYDVVPAPLWTDVVNARGGDIINAFLLDIVDRNYIPNGTDEDEYSYC